MSSDGSSIHRLAWDLIPWIVNGTASEPDRQLAETHIRACADCREELESQRRLQLRMSSALLPEVDVAGSWQALHARLNATSPAAPGASESRRAPRRTRGMAWLAAAVVVQSIGLAALAIALATRGPSTSVLSAGVAPYRTLSSPRTALSSGAVRAVFAPEITVAQLQTLLEQAHLRVVSGPHEGGVWWLAPEMQGVDPNRAVRELRADPLVRFAAPAGGAP